MVNARCFWFEDDGAPVGDGCPKGSHCEFVHPRDSHWDRLPKQSKRPPFALVVATRRSGRRDNGGGYRDKGRDDRDRDSKRSRSPSHRSRHSDRTRRESYEKEKEKEKERAREKEKEQEKKKTTTSSSSPTSTMTPTMPRKDSVLLPTPPTSSNLTATFTSVGSNSKPPPLGPSALMRSLAASNGSARITTSSSTSQLPSSSSRMSVDASAAPRMPSLPPPPLPPPMQPPCPLPEFPKEIEMTMKSASPQPELTIEEKKKTWEERIKLIADALLAKKAFEQADQSYKYALDVSQSQLFSSLTDEEKSRHNHELQSLHADREKSKKTYEEMMREIIERGTWPIGPPPNEGEDREYLQREYGEIVRYVKELREAAMSMGRMLGDIAGMRSPPVLSVVPGVPNSGANEVDDDIYAPAEEDRMEVDRDATDAMVVDGAGAERQHSRKRRRVTDDDEDGISGGTARAVPQQRDPDIPTREELDKLLDKLESIEASTIDLANEITQHEREVTDSFRNEAEEIVTKVEAQRKIKEAREKEKEKARVDGLFESVKGESEALGRDVGVVGDEMAKLIERINQLEVDIEKEERDKERRSAEMKEIEDRLKSFNETREADLRAIQTLEAALEAYKSASSQLSPPHTPSSLIPSAPVHPSKEYILNSLREPIIQLTRDGMKPMLEQCRAETERLVEEKNKKLLEKVWPDMVLVSNILGKMVDRYDEEGIRSAVGTASGGAGGVGMVPAPVSVPVPSTAGGAGTAGLPRPPALLTSPVNMSAEQVQQQLLKIIGAGGTVQVTSPTTPTGVPAPLQQQQQQQQRRASYPPLQQQQKVVVGQSQSQVMQQPPQQQQQEQQVPRPSVPLPVATPTTGAPSGQLASGPYPPPVTGPNWVSLNSPVQTLQAQQEQLVRLFVGGVSPQVQQVKGSVPVTQQQQQHPPAQQPQLQQQQQQQNQGQVQ